MSQTLKEINRANDSAPVRQKRALKLKRQPLLVPTEELPIHWDQVIVKVLTDDILFPRKPSEGEFVAVYIRLYTWEIALHWLIKSEWQKKHKIPAPRASANALKPKGKRLIWLFKLCERCHSFQQELDSGQVPYKHAAFWFDSIFAEIKASEVNHVFYPEEEAPPRREDKKESALHSERAAYQMLKEFYNPLASQASTYPAAFALYEAAIALARHSDAFNDEFFVPYVRAWSAEITQLDKPACGRLFVEDGQAYLQTGRGRQRQPLSLSPKVKKAFSETLVQQGF